MSEAGALGSEQSVQFVASCGEEHLADSNGQNPQGLDLQRLPVFPLGLYMCLSAINLVSCLSISFIWPFVGFMILHFGLTTDQDQVGYYTGLMLSMFFLGRALSGTFWGYIADYHGRKTVIYISICSSGLLMALLGITDNFRDALLVRFLSGFLNPLLTICKVMASEMCDKAHQARGNTFPAVAWLTGLVLGPALGGMLAQPCDSGSSLQWLVSGTEFCKRPFLLPCASGAFLHVLVLPCAFWLPETCQPRARSSTCISVSRARCLLMARWPVVTRYQHNSNSTTAQLAIPEQLEFAGVPNCTDGRGENNYHPEQCKTQPRSAAYEQWLTCMTGKLIALHVGMVIVANLVDNATSIWCMSSVDKHGLAWRADRIGEMYATVGIFSLIAQTCVAPAIINGLGAQRSIVMCNIVIGLSVVLTPLLGWLSPLVGNEFLIFSLLSMLMIARQICSLINFSSLAMIINNSVSAASRCRLQGTTTSAQSAFQVAIPVVSGTLFTWAIGALPLGSEVVFLMSGLCSIALTASARTLTNCE